MRPSATVAISALLLSIPVLAAAPADDTKMFCRDDSGANRPMVRTNFGRFKANVAQFFKWDAAPTMTATSIRFANGEEQITYMTEPYEGGVALVKMQVRLKGANRELVGSQMCQRTYMIVNNVRQ